MEQYPNTGQNPYGQSPPGYSPQYPGTGQSPYGAPPQQGYPGTAPFGQPPTRRPNNRIIVGGVVGIIVVNSPTGTVKGFYDDLFSYNPMSASARLYLDAQNKLNHARIPIESGQRAGDI